MGEVEAVLFVFVVGEDVLLGATGGAEGVVPPAIFIGVAAN